MGCISRHIVLPGECSSPERAKPVLQEVNIRALATVLGSGVERTAG